MKYAAPVAAVICAIIGALGFSAIEESSGLPWWFSEVGLAVGALIGYFAGAKYAQGKQG